MSIKLNKKVTQEMINEAKAKYPNSKIKQASLVDSDGCEIGDILVKSPAPFPLSQFEKFVDKDSAKAKAILIKAVVVDDEQHIEIAGWDKSSEAYAAAFEAAAQMIPIGKATLKEV